MAAFERSEYGLVVRGEPDGSIVVLAAPWGLVVPDEEHRGPIAVHQPRWPLEHGDIALGTAPLDSGRIKAAYGGENYARLLAEQFAGFAVAALDHHLTLREIRLHPNPGDGPAANFTIDLGEGSTYALHGFAAALRAFHLAGHQHIASHKPLIPQLYALPDLNAEFLVPMLLGTRAADGAGVAWVLGETTAPPAWTGPIVAYDKQFPTAVRLLDAYAYEAHQFARVLLEHEGAGPEQFAELRAAMDNAEPLPDSYYEPWGWWEPERAAA